MISQALPLASSLILIFFSSIVGGIVAHKLKIPAVIGYILLGLICGLIFPFLKDIQILRLIAEVGVTLLLFTVGLESSFFRLRKTIKSVFWSVCVQVFGIFTILLFLCLYLFKIPAYTSLFISISAAFSSTAIVVKILSDKMEAETLYGEIITSWLILQDFIIIPFMVIVSSLAALNLNSNDLTFGAFFLTTIWAILRSLLIILFIVIFGKTIIPVILQYIAKFKNREIFILTTVGIVAVSSSLTYVFGLPAPLGAFLAGIMISQTSQNHAIFSEIRPLRDLFTVLFFTSLGLSLNMSYFGKLFPLLIVLLTILTVVKLIIVYFLSRSMQFHRKTAFLVSVLLLPISEFGFILAGIGLNSNLLSEESFVLISLLTFFSILTGVMIISKNELIYKIFFHRFAALFPKYFKESAQNTLNTSSSGFPISDHVVLCGYGRVGRYIGRSLDMAGVPYVVVDYNLNTLTKLKDKGINVVYGDPADKFILDYAQVDLAKAIVIAIPDRHTQEMIISHAFSLNRKIKIICRTHHEEDQAYLRSLGVQTIVQPEFEASLSIIKKLYSDFNIADEIFQSKSSRLKIEHGLG